MSESGIVVMLAMEPHKRSFAIMGVEGAEFIRPLMASVLLSDYDLDDLAYFPVPIPGWRVYGAESLQDAPCRRTYQDDYFDAVAAHIDVRPFVLPDFTLDCPPAPRLADIPIQPQVFTYKEEVCARPFPFANSPIQRPRAIGKVQKGFGRTIFNRKVLPCNHYRQP